MTYRAGLVGVGGVGRQHARAYAETDGIDLVAIADVDGEALREAGEEWDVPDDRRYADHERMLDREALDVVSIATPTFLHGAHVRDAVRLGDLSLIWCEKPIASGVGDAEATVEACRDADVELLVNHVFRFSESLRALRGRLDELLGGVRTANFQFKLELLRNGTHAVDLACWLLGARGERVAGHLTGESDIRGRGGPELAIDDCGGGGYVVMDDGTFLTLDCVVPRTAFNGLYALTGTEGQVLLHEKAREGRYFRFEDGTPVETPLSAIEGGLYEEHGELFPAAAAHAVEVLRGRAENRSPGEDAVAALEILVGLYVSGHVGGAVDLPLARPLRDVTVTSW